jgi:hypothetical protein
MYAHLKWGEHLLGEGSDGVRLALLPSLLLQDVLHLFGIIGQRFQDVIGGRQEDVEDGLDVGGELGALLDGPVVGVSPLAFQERFRDVVDRDSDRFET